MQKHVKNQGLLLNLFQFYSSVKIHSWVLNVALYTLSRSKTLPLFHLVSHTAFVLILTTLPHEIESVFKGKLMLGTQ